MKALYLLLLSSLLVLAGCTGVKSVSSGLENQAYLEILGNPQSFPNGVVVKINDNMEFPAEVNAPNAKRPKGTVYAIPTGSNLVTISVNNETIYRKNIFVGAQETKQITLP